MSARAFLLRLVGARREPDRREPPDCGSCEVKSALDSSIDTLKESSRRLAESAESAAAAVERFARRRDRRSGDHG